MLLKKITFYFGLRNTDNYSCTYFTEPTVPLSNSNILELIESTYGLEPEIFNKRICLEEKQLEKDILSFLNYNDVWFLVCSILGLAIWCVGYMIHLKDRWDMSKPIVIATNLGYKLNNKMWSWMMKI